MKLKIETIEFFGHKDQNRAGSKNSNDFSGTDEWKWTVQKNLKWSADLHGPKGKNTTVVPNESGWPFYYRYSIKMAVFRRVFLGLGISLLDWYLICEDFLGRSHRNDNWMFPFRFYLWNENIAMISRLAKIIFRVELY